MPTSSFSFTLLCLRFITNTLHHKTTHAFTQPGYVLLTAGTLYPAMWFAEVMGTLNLATLLVLFEKTSLKSTPIFSFNLPHLTFTMHTLHHKNKDIHSNLNPLVITVNLHVAVQCGPPKCFKNRKLVTLSPKLRKCTHINTHIH